MSTLELTLLYLLAAVLGVLRFSGLYPIPQWHQFVSMLGACAAFPLLAVAVLWPDAAATRQLKFASIFFICMAVFGVLAAVFLLGSTQPGPDVSRTEQRG